MPNVEELLGTVGQTISEKKPQIFVSTRDLTYANGPTLLSAGICVQCNFSLTGEKSTIKMGHWRPTTMPADIQRTMDSIFPEFPQTHPFIDDILVVTKSSDIDHAVKKWVRMYHGMIKKLKQQVANIVELRHFDVHRNIRIVCDANNNGLGRYCNN